MSDKRGLEAIRSGWVLWVSFGWHAVCRASHVAAVIGEGGTVLQMMQRLSPAVENPRQWMSQPCLEWALAWSAAVFSWRFPSIYRRRCLFRSLLLLDWARGRSVQPTVNIGIFAEDRQTQGHCWLSFGLQVFCEPGGWPARYREPFGGDGGVANWFATPCRFRQAATGCGRDPV